MTPPRPDRAAALLIVTATLLAGCSAPQPARPGSSPAAPGTASAPVAAPTTVATPTPARVTAPTGVAATGPGAMGTAPPTGTSDKGSRLARPTPIGQIAPEEAPPEK